MRRDRATLSLGRRRMLVMLSADEASAMRGLKERRGDRKFASESPGFGRGSIRIPVRGSPDRQPRTEGGDLAPPLLKRVLPNTANQEVAVYEAEYEPGGMNPRHLHPAAITLHILAGTGVWQEEGKPPVTLKAGDSLLVPAGTIHSHSHPTATMQ